VLSAMFSDTSSETHCVIAFDDARFETLSVDEEQTSVSFSARERPSLSIVTGRSGRASLSIATGKSSLFLRRSFSIESQDSTDTDLCTSCGVADLTLPCDAKWCGTPFAECLCPCL